MKKNILSSPFYKTVFKTHPITLVFLVACIIFVACFSGSTFGVEAVRSFDPARAGARICLSLRVLASDARLDPQKVQVREMAGIGWLEGYVIDPENRDIILIGRRHPNWPYIHLDDLVAGMRNVWGNKPDPYCSLDPRPEDVKKLNQVSAEMTRAKGENQKQDVLRRFKKAVGLQMVVVGGVPRNSRHAHIMIDADYHMKKLSKDLASIPGIPSCLDINLQNAEQAIRKGKNPDMGLSMSRFWFHVAGDDPVFQEADGIVWLDRCSVVVLTERQRAGSDGVLYDSGEDDPVSQAFAGNLTKRFREASHKVPVYAQLENLFRLNALFRAMYFRNAVNAAKLDIRFLLERYAYQAEYKMPDFLEGLANAKELRGRERKGNRIEEYILYSIACGGVSMEMPVKQDRFVKTAETPLDRIRNAILSSRPTQDTLTWILP
jgi:hypothetical protein